MTGLDYFKSEGQNFIFCLTYLKKTPAAEEKDFSDLKFDCVLSDKNAIVEEIAFKISYFESAASANLYPCIWCRHRIIES